MSSHENRHNVTPQKQTICHSTKTDKISPHRNRQNVTPQKQTKCHPIETDKLSPHKNRQNVNFLAIFRPFSAILGPTPKWNKNGAMPPLNGIQGSADYDELFSFFSPLCGAECKTATRLTWSLSLILCTCNIFWWNWTTIFVSCTLEERLNKYICHCQIV